MPGHPADRGDRRAAVGDAELGQPLAGGEDRVEVHRRLPHAHEDDVVDRFAAAEVQRLVEDLIGAEVAAELHLAGGAEGAGQRAARLRGEADRATAVAEAHQHRLDRAPVGGVEERLDGAVVGLRLGLQRERRERHRRGEPLAQRRRQVGHLLVGPRARAPPTPRPGRRGRRARRRRRACSRAGRDPSAECTGAGRAVGASRFESRMSEPSRSSREVQGPARGPGAAADPQSRGTRARRSCSPRLASRRWRRRAAARRRRWAGWTGR